MASLAVGDDAELEDRMAQRVEFSLRAIAKLVAAFDAMQGRNTKVQQLVNQLREPSDVANGNVESSAGSDKKNTANPIEGTR